jgi:hypothetical protein
MTIEGTNEILGSAATGGGAIRAGDGGSGRAPEVVLNLIGCFGHKSLLNLEDRK